MRMYKIIQKELKSVKENYSFNLITLMSPLMFLLVFTLMLSDGITFPFNAYPDVKDSAFLQSAAEYKAPGEIPYVELIPSDNDKPATNAERDLIVVKHEPAFENGVYTGEIVHYINDVNQNTTKNSRNRLDGALVDFINTTRDSGNILVVESTVYDKDVPWDTGFGVSTFVFGMMLSGLMFGVLSMTSEWENKTTKLLKLSPFSSRMIIIGKMFANIIKCIISGLLYLIIFAVISHAWPLRSATFILLALLIYAMFTCVGMFIGIFINNTLVALVVSMATALTLWILGGGFGPLSFFGEIANFCASVDPATYAIDIARWCYFGGRASLSTSFVFLGLLLVAVFAIMAFTYSKWVRSEEVGI